MSLRDYITIIYDWRIYSAIDDNVQRLVDLVRRGGRGGRREKLSKVRRDLSSEYSTQRRNSIEMTRGSGCCRSGCC